MTSRSMAWHRAAPGLALVLWAAAGCTLRRSPAEAPAAAPDSVVDTVDAARPVAEPEAPAASDAVAASPAVPDAEPPPALFGQCAGTPGDKPIMAPCADHCECSTGYCYDEGYPGGGGRFCSMDCNRPSIGDCAEIRHPTRPQFQKYGCLQLNALARAHDLKTARICVLRCQSVDECKRYSPRYDRCGNASGGRMTQWAGHTLGLFGTCLVSSAISPEAPGGSAGP